MAKDIEESSQASTKPRIQYSNVNNRSINEIFEEFHSGKNELFVKIQELLILSESKLPIIKSAFKDNPEKYLEVSNEIAEVSIACLIHAYNNSNAQFKSSTYLELFEEVGLLEMSFETKKKHLNNLTIIRNNYSNELESNSSNEVADGCYIATMVYGDYNHPQVLVLRDFRDSFLVHFYLGRSFIKFYYEYSPSWVKALENKKTFNKIIKGILNKFIYLIK